MRLINALLSAMGAMAQTQYDMQAVTLGGNSLLRTSSDDIRFADAYMENAVQVPGDSSSNTVEWKIPIAHAGYYNIHFGFALDDIALPVELDLYQDEMPAKDVRGDHSGVQFIADSLLFGQVTETIEVYLYEGHHKIQLRGNPSMFTDTSSSSNIVSIDYLAVEAKPELPECVQRFDISDAQITGGGNRMAAPRVGRYSLGWTGDGHLINFATLPGGVNAEGEEVSWPTTVTWDDITMEGDAGTLIFRYALQPEERDGQQLVSSEMKVKVNDDVIKSAMQLEPTGDKRFFRVSAEIDTTFFKKVSLNSVTIESVDTRPGAHIDYLEVHDDMCVVNILAAQQAAADAEAQRKLDEEAAEFRQFCQDNPDDPDCKLKAGLIVVILIVLVVGGLGFLIVAYIIDPTQVSYWFSE